MGKVSIVIEVILIWATVLAFIVGTWFIAEFDIVAYVPALIVSVFLIVFAILATSVTGKVN